jgi:small subunit ribosomal protein S6
MSTDFKRVRDYELMVVFHPELSEEDLASESQKVEAHITSVNGSVRLVNREAPWGRRRLAYPIRNGGRDVRDGVYVLYYFTSESGRLGDIEREIKLQDRILRYLLTLQSAPVMEPAPAEGEEAEATGEAVADGTGATTSADAPTEASTENAPAGSAPAENGAAESAPAENAAAESVPAVTAENESAAEAEAPEESAASEETPA